MKAFPQLAFCAALSLAVAFGPAGCKHNTSPDSANQANSQDQNQPQDQSQAGDQSQDPANANVAPVSNASDNTGEPQGSYASSGQSTAGQQPQYAQNGQSSSGAPSAYSPNSNTRPYTTQEDPYTNYSSGQNYGNYNNYYTPTEYAPQPPPPLAQYQQPVCPGPNYIWTPGYWSFDRGQGYYWVPGAWVLAPYQGALWTPGWWGYTDGRYGWHRGYWGRHIGYYGGIDYGFGYVGFGYQGGYWNGGQFAYNRSVNNVNTTVVRNVYNYRITNVHVTRVSYNGGQGGIDRRPRPAEVEAMHEQHNPPMNTQLQLRQEARGNRQNFAKVSHDHPALVAVSHPVPADRNVRPPEPVRFQGQNQRPNQPMQQRNMQQAQHGNPPTRPGTRGNERPPAQAHGMYRATPPEQRPMARPQQPMHPSGQQRAEQGRGSPGSREAQHTGAQHPVQPNRPEANRPETPQHAGGPPEHPHGGADRGTHATEHPNQQEVKHPRKERPQ